MTFQTQMRNIAAKTRVDFVSITGDKSLTKRQKREEVKKLLEQLNDAIYELDMNKNRHDKEDAMRKEMIQWLRSNRIRTKKRYNKQ